MKFSVNILKSLTGKRKHVVAVVLAVAVLIIVFYPSSDTVKYNKELMAIDTLSDEHPQKAIARLQEFKRKHKILKISDRWYLRLLEIKTNDKLFVVQKSPESALKMVRHFENVGESGKMLAQAYYYAGCAYRDVNDMPMALEYYHKAKNEYGEHVDRFSSALDFQIGYLLFEQSFYNSSLPYFRDVLRMDSLMKDTTMMVYTLQKIAYAYQGMDNDSCLHYYGQALDLSRQKGEKNLYNEMLSSMAAYYLQKGMYAKAKDMALPVLFTAGDGNPNLDSFYDVLALSYFRLGQKDSSRYYFTKLYSLNSLEARKEACKYLAKIYCEDGEMATAQNYMAQYGLYEDSLKKRNVETSIARMNALYNYSKYKERNIQLEEKARRNAMLISLSAFVAVFFLFFGALRYRKLKKVEQERSMRLQKFRTLLMEHSEKSIHERENKIAELEEELSKTKSLYAAKAREMELLMENMKNRSNIVSNERALSDNVKVMFMDTEIYSIIEAKAKVHQPLNDKEAEMLVKETDRLFPSFKLGLYSICSLSYQDYLLCILIKVSNLSSSTIAVLLGRGRSTISKAKAKLQKKMLGKNCLNEEFDQFLKSL